MAGALCVWGSPRINTTHDPLLKFERRGRLCDAPEQKAALIAPCTRRPQARSFGNYFWQKVYALHGVKDQAFDASFHNPKCFPAKHVLPTPRIGRSWK
jgi:hypothetical protein